MRQKPAGRPSSSERVIKDSIAELCRREARELKEVVAEQTLDMLSIPRTTFYRWRV